MSTGPLMTRPARYDDVPSCTTPLSRGGVQFEESTLPPASRERAFLTASQPADFMKKASVNSVGMCLESAISRFSILSLVGGGLSPVHLPAFLLRAASHARPFSVRRYFWSRLV